MTITRQQMEEARTTQIVKLLIPEATKEQRDKFISEEKIVLGDSSLMILDKWNKFKSQHQL